MIKAEVYLFHLKQTLIKEARETYNDSLGGPGAIQEYKYALRRIKSAPTLGDLFRVARDMNLGLGSTLRLALNSFVDLDIADLQEAPEKW